MCAGKSSKWCIHTFTGTSKAQALQTQWALHHSLQSVSAYGLVVGAQWAYRAGERMGMGEWQGGAGGLAGATLSGSLRKLPIESASDIAVLGASETVLPRRAWWNNEDAEGVLRPASLAKRDNVLKC